MGIPSNESVKNDGAVQPADWHYADSRGREITPYHRGIARLSLPEAKISVTVLVLYQNTLTDAQWLSAAYPPPTAPSHFPAIAGLNSGCDNNLKGWAMR